MKIVSKLMQKHFARDLWFFKTQEEYSVNKGYVEDSQGCWLPVCNEPGSKVHNSGGWGEVGWVTERVSFG